MRTSALLLQARSRKAGALRWRQVDGLQEDLLNPIPVFARQRISFGLKCYPILWHSGRDFAKCNQTVAKLIRRAGVIDTRSMSL